MLSVQRGWLGERSQTSKLRVARTSPGQTAACWCPPRGGVRGRQQGEMLFVSDAKVYGHRGGAAQWNVLNGTGCVLLGVGVALRGKTLTL